MSKILKKRLDGKCLDCSDASQTIEFSRDANELICMHVDLGARRDYSEMFNIECWSHGERIYLDEGTSYHVTLLTQRSRCQKQQGWT